MIFGVLLVVGVGFVVYFGWATMAWIQGLKFWRNR